LVLHFVHVSCLLWSNQITETCWCNLPVGHYWSLMIKLRLLIFNTTEGCLTGLKTLCPSSILLKVKQSHYMPWQALRGPRGWDSQILRQSAHEVGKVVSPMHWSPLLPRNIPGNNFF
jgi:hypothetical protein